MASAGKVVLVAALALVAFDGLLVVGWIILSDLINRGVEPEPVDRGGHVRVVRR